MKFIKCSLILSICVIYCQSQQNDTNTTDDDEDSSIDQGPAHPILMGLNNDKPVMINITKLSNTELNLSDTINNIKSTGILLSLPFLLGTIIVYLSLRELRNNRGTVLMNYFIGCLIIAFAAFYCIKIKLMNFSKYLCFTIDILCYFFFFASLFWSTVMSYDIWRTIKQLSPQSVGFKNEKRKFLIYSLFAWGCPLIFTSVNVIMNKIDKNVTDSSYCWFNDETTINIYLYAPQAVITCCNTIFFIMTIHMTRKIQRDIASHMRGKDSQRHDENNHWFHLCFKLSIVMGVGWSLELFALLLNSILPKNSWITQAAQLPSDIIVSSQGVIIFIVFVCMGKPRKLLLKKLGWQKKSLADSQATINTSINTISN